jgi:filamentous hemagglutinin family protein
MQATLAMDNESTNMKTHRAAFEGEQTGFKLKPAARISLLLAFSLVAAMNTGVALALPAGEQVAAGTASFQRQGNNLRIDQASQKTIVNWQSFGIAAHEAVNLYQPKQGTALFRVLGSDPSQIYGKLTATGSLYLSNPNGILFGPGAQVDVGSLVATTMRINDQDFLSNRLHFFSESDAAVVNRGVIRTSDGGFIALLGERVENSGTLAANQGSVVLGSGQSAVLDMFGDGLVKVNLSGEALNSAIEQAGLISANGGQIQIASNARNAAINVSGVVQANSLVERNGSIRLEGGSGSKVAVSGLIETKGNMTDSKGGQIIVSGEQVALLSNASLDASGHAGGGEILLGGDYQGSNTEIHNARTAYVAHGANMHVDAISSGDGGKTIVWADQTTRYYGSISAKGGADIGNGGFVEVSGKRQLDFSGKIDVGANNGIGGKVLLDPENIVLNSSTQPSPPNQADGTPDIAFFDAPAADTTTVQIADIVNFSELFLQATNDITVASTLTMAANNSIRLEANNNLNVNAAITTSGTGAIALKADADSSGSGTLAIGNNITSRVGGITLSGAAITRSAGSIASSGATGQSAGNIQISASGAINLGAAAVTATGGAATASNPGNHGGTITINGASVSGTGTITANGGNASSGTGGNTGSIHITANSGNIAIGALNARAGNSVATNDSGSIGSIQLNASNGSISTGAITTTGGSGGNGSDVSITASGNYITTGNITTSGGTRLSNFSGKHAGKVEINAGNNIDIRAVTAVGSNATNNSQAGGDAGLIKLVAGDDITTNNQALTSRGGNGHATASGGAAAGIELQAQVISTGSITTSGGTNANGGNIQFDASGNITTGALASSGGAASTDFAGRNAGTISLDAGGNITTTSIAASGSSGVGAGQAGGNASSITLTADGNVTTTTLTASGGNAAAGATANGGAAGQIDIAAGGSVTTGNITLRTGNSTFGGSVTTGGNVAIIGSEISTGSITTTGGNNGVGSDIDITTTGALSAGTIVASGGNANTNSSGNHAGNVTLNSASALNTLAITAAGSSRNGSGTDGGNGGNVVLTAANGTSSITTRSITTTGGNGDISGKGGDITLTGNTLLSANTTMAAMGGNTGAGNGGNVRFNGTLDASGGNRTLTINSNGNTTFEGAVGNALAFGSITTNAGGSTIINGGSVKTTGSQTYGDAVNLGAATTFTTSNTNTNLTFTGPVNANGHDVSMNIVRDITANNLGNDFGRVLINSGRNVSLRDTNALELGASSVGGILNLGTSGDITQSGAVTVAGTTTLAAGTGNIALSNAGNDFNAITISNGNNVNITDQNAMSLNASTVGSLLARTLSGNLTLAGNISASNGGDAIRLVTAGNFITSGNRSLSTPGGRWLVYSTDPALDTRSTNMLSAHDFKQYNASFGDTILGANDGFIYAVAPVINANMSGSVASKIYDGTSTATTAGLNVSYVSGAIDGDSVTLGTITSASFSDKNADVGKVVTGVFDITASKGGKSVHGYQVGTVNSSATGDIDQRPISVIVDSGQSKVIGQADPVFTFSVGDMGLATGDSLLDAFSGLLARSPGETLGNYAITQGTLLTNSNYRLTGYTGNDFTIAALPPTPPTSDNGTISIVDSLPRDAAGLVDANPQFNALAGEQLFVLNLTPTAAGGAEEQGNLTDCEPNTEQIANNPDAAIMINFGMALPDGVKNSCI